MKVFGKDINATGKFWIGILAVISVTLGAGWLFGQLIINSAQQNQECIKPASLDSWQGLRVSSVPSGLQSSFGYGRGTQIIESTITVEGQRGADLPESITLFASPLIGSGGSVAFQPLSNAVGPAANQGISAVATRISSSSMYGLEVCIIASDVAPGSYTSQLMFPGATLPAGNVLPVMVPVTVTFKSEAVPYLLTMGVVPLSLLGMIYCTVILLRRRHSDVTMGQLFEYLHKALWSINGVIAFILSIGAVFAVWNLQCYRSLTWGSPWTTTLVTLVTMASAAAGASTVPMGLSKD
jgi:hypothetical protein